MCWNLLSSADACWEIDTKWAHEAQHIKASHKHPSAPTLAKFNQTLRDKGEPS